MTGLIIHNKRREQLIVMFGDDELPQDLEQGRRQEKLSMLRIPHELLIDCRLAEDVWGGGFS